MTTSIPEINGSLIARGMRFGIVAARFNERIVDRLIRGAIDCLVRHGADPSDILLVRVPGAFEIPGGLKALTVDSGSRPAFDALIALGAVIRGETPHFDYVCSACTSGCQHVDLEIGVPVGFGVLTCDTTEQAEARAGGKTGNKGAEAALAVIEIVDVRRQLQTES